MLSPVISQISWKKLNGIYGENVACIVENHSKHIFIGTDHRGVYYSTNEGESWTKIQSLGDLEITSIIINGKETIFIGTYKKGIFTSTDNGLTWSNPYFQDNEIQDLAINENGNIITSVYQHGVYFSNESGKIWEYIGFKDKFIYKIAINNKNDIFVFTSNDGSFRSSDTGKTWNKLNLNFDNPKNIIFGKDGTTIISYAFRLYTSHDDGETLNEFFIPEYSHVSLKIFDMLGREITVLANENKNTGRYKYQWNAINYPSGIYFYQLQTDKFTETKKLLLLR
jgi:photosystem II stability/assembly factor-like uncharacterized protein